MSYLVGDSFQLKLNQFTEEIQNLQSKCKGEGDIRQSDLSKLSTILKDVTSMNSPALENKKFVQEEPGQNSVARAIMAILSFQRCMPSQLDTKAITEMLAKLFATLSVEMHKLEENDKKFERHKRFKRQVEKSEKTKKSAE